MIHNKCTCGGTFQRIEGLEGYTCDVCGAYRDTLIDTLYQPDYSEEKMKSIRGIPVNRIIIGSESKGRVEISIPIFVPFEEQKEIINQQLMLMEYTKAQILERNLDIMPKR